MDVTFAKIPGINAKGERIMYEPARLDADFYRRAMAAPRGKAISLSQAMDLVWGRIWKLVTSDQIKEAVYMTQECDWVSYISDLGLHIEFAADDFKMPPIDIAA